MVDSRDQSLELGVSPELSSLRDLDPERARLPWYVVQTYSGFESRAKMSLEERIRSMGITHKFGNILVPHESVMEVHKGQKRRAERKLFPGYMLVQMQLDDETWHVVSGTSNISGFVGGDLYTLSPLPEDQVATLMQQMQSGVQKPKAKITFDVGDSVKVTDGPFTDFNGTIDEIKPDKGKLRVLISIFGRNTPVELDFTQVEKV